MKRIKYCICILLIAAGFLFNGELFTLYLDNFQESYYQSTFAFAELPSDLTNQEMVEDFLKAGEENNVDFFMIDSQIKSAYQKEITIYGTENARKQIEEHRIAEDKYRSFFLGTTTVRFENFDQIDPIKNYDQCYYIGDQDKEKDLSSFKAQLIEQYGGGFPKRYGSDRETWFNLFSVWGVIFGLILLMTIYDVIYQKKETMVRTILGENPGSIFRKSALTDTCVFTFIFLILPILMRRGSDICFKLPQLSMVFILFLFINLLINTAILHIDFKRDMAGAHNKKTLLIANYSLKIATGILTIIVLSSNFIIVMQGIDVYRQHGFFEKHKDYSYYRLNYKPDISDVSTAGMYEVDPMNQAFHQRFAEAALHYNDISENFSCPYPVILTNRNSMEEIFKEYPEIAKARSEMTDERSYLLLPPEITIGSEEYLGAEKNYNGFFKEQSKKQDLKVITYDTDIDLVAINNRINFESRMLHKPMILFNNTNDGSNYYTYDTMFDIPDAEFQKFVREFELEDQIVVKSNVMEVYKHNWDIVSRSMRLSLVLSAFLILLEMSLVSFIIRLEYRFNSVEMALKKIYGYTIFERNKRIIKTTVIHSILSILGALILSIILGATVGMALIGSGVILFALELCCIIRKARSIEKVRLAAVLKGERI